MAKKTDERVWKEFDNNDVRMLLDMKHFPDEIKKIMFEDMKRAYRNAEPRIVEEIVKNNIISGDELLKMMPEYEDEISNSLVLYLDSVRVDKMAKMKDPDDNVTFVTVNEAIIRNKQKLEKRFGVKILSPKEASEDFKKRFPDKYKQMVDHIEKERIEDIRAKNYIG